MNSEKQSIAQPNSSGERKEDDFLCDFELPTVISCDTVDAVCRKVSTVFYGPYNQRKLVFEFQVVEPEAHSGTKLMMYVHYPEKWKGRPPLSSKLAKVLWVVSGTGGQHRRRVTKSMFEGKVFRCRVGANGTGMKKADDRIPYSRIETILQRLTGDRDG